MRKIACNNVLSVERMLVKNSYTLNTKFDSRCYEKKKNIVIVICVLFIIQRVQVFAYNYPTNFWTINTKYGNAINTSTHDKIIEYGN